MTTVDPDKWTENEEFQQAVKFVKRLRVVNDIAERGVKLTQDFDCSITKNEEQKQFLLQIVSTNKVSSVTELFVEQWNRVIKK